MMKYKREDRVKILEYKFVFEEEIQVEKEYQEGSADLNYRLSFFRNKLKTSNNSNDQKARYDKTFMGHIPNENSTDIQINQIDEQEDAQSALKAKSLIKPWAKKVYRQIVMVTHPDKTDNIQSNHLKEQLTEQYRITQNAYQKEIYSDLIMVAFDLNIGLPNNVISEEIEPNSLKKINKIKATKKLIGWQWFHVPEAQRDAELKKILTAYGFEFSEKEVSDVIKIKRIKRKVGTRPKNIRKERNSNNLSNKIS